MNALRQFTKLRDVASKLVLNRAYATHIVTPENCSIKCYTNNNVSYATTSTDFHLIPDTLGFVSFHCVLFFSCFK